jgi:peptide chain release factor 2
LVEKDYRENQRELFAVAEKVKELYSAINIEELKKELGTLEKETFKEDFWKDPEKSAKINRQISILKKKTETWDKLRSDTDETEELMEMALHEGDSEVLNDICETITGLGERLGELETQELLSEEDDFNNAFITIHPGAGGTESQDWASMLFRMYYRWGEKNNFKADVIDYMPGEEAGIKSATILFKGDYAYGLLKGEMGIHRLVRISPFDSNKRRHTSFASVEVVPEVGEELEIEINESDLRIDTYRASGAGGQHVNTSDSAVRITHVPSGIVVQCQNERSQHKNKAFAMKVLKARLHDHYRQQEDEKLQDKMGEKKDISWGNQIRSYVFQPYTMVKDHRTNEETGSVDYVFDGEINRFIYAYLKKRKLSD